MFCASIARHVGIPLAIEDWERIGYEVPLLVNMQPAGKYLGEEYYRAGGLPAVLNELMGAGRIHANALTINGKTIGENVKDAKIADDGFGDAQGRSANTTVRSSGMPASKCCREISSSPQS